MKRSLVLLALLSGCGGPPQAAPGQILGSGTPGVSAYLPPGIPDTLAAQVYACQDVPQNKVPQPKSFDAACDQLRRTLVNQPGNSK